MIPEGKVDEIYQASGILILKCALECLMLYSKGQLKTENES